jgi:enterochelin esterase-like enzyme
LRKYLALVSVLCALVCAITLLAQTPAPPWYGGQSLHVRGPHTDEHGILEYEIQSEYQPGWQLVRVLLPKQLDPGRKYPVLYILPVDTDLMERRNWGSGIEEARKLNLASEYSYVCVAPVLAQTPWYADRPNDPNVRQESYLLNVIIPFVEHTFPASTDSGDRLLIGFSKSGYGAFTLLLRHPDKFGCAAAWDSPWSKQAPDQWGMEEVYATQENFDKYKFAPLLKSRAEELRRQTAKRLILLGYGAFPEDVRQAGEELQDLQIPHVYRNDTKRQHSWTSGWMGEAVSNLANCNNDLHSVTPAPSR